MKAFLTATIVAASALSTTMCPAQTAVRPAVKPYSVSPGFRNVVNYAAFNKVVAMTAGQKEMLQRNLFFCYPRGDKQLYWVYGRNDYRNLPSFVTTDALLQLHHVFYDSTLRNIEENVLELLCRRMTASLRADALNTFLAVQDPSLKPAALKNLAYVEVADRLLGGRGPMRMEAAPMVRLELDLIGKAQGYQVGAIFPYKIDYSQFIVRGHYTKSPKLTRYFKAMMWYGSVPMALKYEMNGRWVRADEVIRQSLLLTRSLYRSGAIRDWERIYEPTSLFVGASNDLTPAEWKSAMERTYGSNPPVSALADGAKLADFTVQVEQLRKARIQHAREDKGRPDTSAMLKLMGQRYIPDSEVMQKLCGPNGQQARLPRGLDVAAAFGSERAAEILDSDPGAYNPGGWADYVPIRRRLSQGIAQVPAGTWRSNLYWGWLNMLRSLLTPFPEGYPSFMRSSAWMDKSLNAALASWAELRHDTILYGQQSAAERGDGEEPPFVPGYVEPNTTFFDRLIALTKQSRDELARRQLLSRKIGDRYVEFLDMLGFLRSVAVRELRNGKMTKKEHERIRHIEGELENLTEQMLLAAGNYVALSEDDLDMGLVADVHTGKDSALEEGVGHSNEIVVVVPVEGKLYLARGATFSYYEFTVPISQRMTDEAWKKALAEKRVPAPPAWTKSFVLKSTPTQREE